MLACSRGVGETVFKPQARDRITRLHRRLRIPVLIEAEGIPVCGERRFAAALIDDQHAAHGLG
jgi:hypothetical protein